MKKRKIIFYSISILLILIIISFFIYTSFYYQTSKNAKEYLKSNEEVEVIVDKNITFKPKDEIKGGIIFYPGAKVEHTAYAELMFKLAEEGYLCVLVKMPFKLAIFGVNKAEKIIDKYDKIDNWHMMGHSLGGAMISKYVSKNNKKIKSVILLASYSTKNISNLNVLSIYGSNDRILNKENYEKNKINLPKDFIEIIIEGGNHANFGSYGSQKGDGPYEIYDKNQIEITVNEVKKFLNSII